MLRLKRIFKRRRVFDKTYLPQERRKSRTMVFIFLWSLVISWLVESFVFSLEVIEGTSMYPIFEEGGFYFVNKYIYNFTEPKRGDVVTIKNIWLVNEEQIIKRVIGVPGDTIEIKNGHVYLNGELLKEPYVRGITFPDTHARKIDENMYFVLGDNREYSEDSRSFGYVRESYIRGKLIPGRLFTIK